MSGKRVIGVVGMPGSGKVVVDKVAGELGFSVVVMGDVIREETAKRGLDPTPENTGKIMLKIRDEEGPTVVAKRCVPKIQNSPSTVVVVEGLRSLAEADEFKKAFPAFTLLAIHSSPETRFQRVFKRKRSDDPASWKVFTERDLRELEVGIGSAIALADRVIVNEGTLAQFRAKIRVLLKG